MHSELKKWLQQNAVDKQIKENQSIYLKEDEYYEPN
jgi:hypothetical protein